MSGQRVDADFMVEMAHRKVGETQWSALELYALGEQLVSLVAVVEKLGHFSPAGSLDYMHPSGVIWNDYLLDFVAWTSGRVHKSPGCEKRLREHNEESGWRKHKDDQMAAAISSLFTSQTPADEGIPQSSSAA